MNGTLYGVGVGPGDPELLTTKAVRILQTADVIACPEKDHMPGSAYHIAVRAVPSIESKELLLLSFPMVKEDLTSAHRNAAARILQCLCAGKSVAFLTLGDPTFYSSFSYISQIIQKEDVPVEIINGIPSFCAAAAKLLLPLAVGDESVLITTGELRNDADTCIVMKCGRKLDTLKQKAANLGRQVCFVENCGMDNEAVCRDMQDIPDQAGYFSVLIVKEKKDAVCP